MCEYCDRQTYQTFTVMENNEMYVDILIENMGGHVRIIGIGDNDAIYTPKYCPECGRKLYDEEEEGEE